MYRHQLGIVPYSMRYDEKIVSAALVHLSSAPRVVQEKAAMYRCMKVLDESIGIFYDKCTKKLRRINGNRAS